MSVLSLIPVLISLQTSSRRCPTGRGPQSAQLCLTFLCSRQSYQPTAVHLGLWCCRENMEGVLVWVIQRNITNRVCMISYKELAHIVMEAQKSHSLQLASWRPRKDDGVCSSLSLSSNQRQEKTDVPA